MTDKISFTIILSYPAKPEHATEWHPTERVGSFCKLVRGVFATEDDAHQWAKDKRIHPETYEVKTLEPIPVEEADSDLEMQEAIKSLLKLSFQGNVRSFSELTPMEQDIVKTPEIFRKICDFAGVSSPSGSMTLDDQFPIGSTVEVIKDDGSRHDPPIGSRFNVVSIDHDARLIFVDYHPIDGGLYWPFSPSAIRRVDAD